MTALSARDQPQVTLSRAWNVWLALLPVLPPLALLGVLGLARLRQFPRPVLWMVGAYGLSQVMAALLAPQPGLALLLGLWRGALLVGLLALGGTLGDPRALRHLRLGLLVVYVTALVNGFALQGWALTQLRLTHPYYTPVSLALAGALGLWLALDRHPGERWCAGWAWRLPLGSLGLLSALLSGSRGPLGVALLGALLLAARGRRQLLGVAGAAALLVALSLSGVLQGTALQRLGSLDATGRDLIWNDTLSVAHAHPLGGVGSYLLGERIAPPGQPCVWFEALEVRGIPCPAAVARLDHMWLIAHNGFLQALAETGLIGTAGLFLLLGALLAAALASGQPLAITVVLGLLLADLTDNVTLVPGPVFSEVFWLVGGWALARRATSWPAAALWGGGALALTAFPLWATLAPVSPQGFQLSGLVAPRTWRADEPYAAAALFDVPPGSYRAQLRACQDTCVTVATRPFTVSAEVPADWQWLIGPLPAPGQLGRQGQEIFTLEYRVTAGTAPPWRVRPLAERRWTVRVQRP